MKLAILIQNPMAGSSRFRILQYLDRLSAGGIDAETVIIPDGAKNRLATFSRLRAFDVVLLQKKLFSLPELKALRRCAKRLVYDFDDAVMYRDSWHDKFESRVRAARFRRTVQSADLVIAGNDYLADHAAKHARNVRVIPTGIDAAAFEAEGDAGAGEGVVLGWIGSGSTVGYLQLIGDILRDILSDDPRLSLVVVSDRFERLPRGLPAQEREWSAESECAVLRDFDIGLMPLFDDPWTRGKCGFKILQYFAAGIPCVCSPVGVNAQIVDDGKNGFLASDAGQWRTRLKELVASPQLRDEMGRHGCEKVREQYSVEVLAPLLQTALYEVVGGANR